MMVCRLCYNPAIYDEQKDIYYCRYQKAHDRRSDKLDNANGGGSL